jgi:hypothetical protein
MKHRLSAPHTKSLRFLVVCFALLLVGSLPLSAQTAGYDLFQTSPGTFVNLSSFNLGNVKLKGVPIQPCTGNTDTIMHRTSDVPGSGSTPVEVTALFMQSVNSVTVNGQQIDLYVTINNSNGTISTNVLPQPDALPLSTGTVTINADGTFDSKITVNADLIGVPAGASVTNPANWVSHTPAPSITLTSSGSPWHSTPPAGYPSCAPFPSGGFFPFPVHNGPHPVTPSTCNDVVAADPTPVGAAKANPKGQANAAAVTVVQKCVSAQ